MRYKNDKQYQIFHLQIRFFFKLKLLQNLLSAGALPRTRWGSLRRFPTPQTP